MNDKPSAALTRRTALSLTGTGVAASLAPSAVEAAAPTGGPLQDARGSAATLDRGANLADLADPAKALANLQFTPAAAGGVPRSVALVLDDWSNSVMNFGAVGDGSADDTRAFVQAMAAYAGRQVFLPPDRRYRLGAVGGLGPAGAGLTGVAGYNTIVSPLRGFAGSIFYNPHAGSIGSAYGLIRDLRFDLLGQDCTAIDLSHCDTWVVERVNGRGGSSRAAAAGVMVRFGAPSNSSSYNNVVRDCGAEYFSTAVAFGANANQNRIDGGTFTNNGVAVDCAPDGSLARPQILGARIEGNGIGVREGAQGGAYLAYFEDNRIGDLSFTGQSSGAVILPGTTSATTRDPLHNIALARDARCLSFDLGYRDEESQPSRPAFEQRRQIRTAPGAEATPSFPAGDFTDLFMQPVWLGNEVSLESVNASNDGSVMLMRCNSAGQLELMSYDRKIGGQNTVNIGGGPSVRPLGTGVTNLGDDERRFRTANLSGGVHVAGHQVLGPQRPAIADATGPIDVVRQLNAALECLRAHGLIAR